MTGWECASISIYYVGGRSTILFKMPKVVDNYVFERRIGSGQYGDVFKGYNKANGMDIAIKAIKRESIKGMLLAIQASSWSSSKTKSKSSRPATT